MSKLIEQINNDLKTAMRAKDELSLSVLRMLTGAIKNKEISLRTGEGDKGLDDSQIIDVIKSEIKKRNDSVSAYLSGGRNDLADKEMAEAKVLEKYMPAQLSDAEIAKEVQSIIDSLGEIKPSDFGKVMGQAMAKLKGKADGNKVGEAVKKLLNK